jgi:hypothetical protein
MAWKKIDNYEVSTNGIVRRNNKKIKTQISLRGYESVQFWVNGKRKRHMVHKLVAKLFIDNPRELTEVNHKDGNKLNNNAENLEWCTRSENIQHAHDTGLAEGWLKGKSGAKHPRSHKINIDGIEYGSIREASRETGYHYRKLKEIAQ